jgi:predicted nucleic acid-binding protein
MNKKIKVLFDTNILVYAHDESATYHTDSAELLKLAIENQIQGVLAEQNIIELYRILTNSVAMKGTALNPLQTNDLINSTYFNGNFEILYPTKFTVKKVLELAVKNNIISAQIFDIRLVALILDHNIDYLATYNINHFQGISDINPLKPPEILNIINNSTT